MVDTSPVGWNDEGQFANLEEYIYPRSSSTCEAPNQTFLLLTLTFSLSKNPYVALIKKIYTSVTACYRVYLSFIVFRIIVILTLKSTSRSGRKCAN